MPGLRLLLRFAPFIVGAVAAAVWLRRRQAARLALGTSPAAPALEPPSDARRAGSGRFERNPQPERPRQDASIDIVTVVDDLLQAGR